MVMQNATPASTQALPDRPEILIGIIADTHIPDRVGDLHPDILPIFRDAGVSNILHAGDISLSRVLHRLSEVAPVTAVRGNRDIFSWSLKKVEYLDLNGKKVALMHGHGGILDYLRDKLMFYREGYKLDRYLDLLVNTASEADVIIFGHTHYPVVHQYKGKLIINPGSASFGPRRGNPPSIALLHIHCGDVKPEIIPLNGWKIRERRWVKV